AVALQQRFTILVALYVLCVARHEHAHEVIDFIDMDEPRNNRAVERKLKDSLKQDRARIQVGRISSFGLLEMSRQRMRSGVLEGSTDTCPHCQGTGMIRSTESAALQVLRAVEAEALKGRAKALDVNVPIDIAVFILNQKRTTLLDIERRGRVSVYMVADASLISPDYSIKRTDDRTPDVSEDTDALSMESAFDDEEDAALDAQAEAAARSEEEADASANKDSGNGDDADGDGEDKPKRRRRRRRGRKSDSDAVEKNSAEDGESADAAATDAAGSDEGDGETPELDEDGKPRKRRRRGRRGGRRHRRTADADGEGTSESDNGQVETTAKEPGFDGETNQSDSTAEEEAPVLVAYSSGASEPMVVDQSQTSAEASTAPPSEPENKADEAVAETAASTGQIETTAEVEAAEKPAEPTKRGWWQRRLSS
ncbi:MAG: ribonuclease E/G, partial [Pseudomonadota bacterium]